MQKEQILRAYEEYDQFLASLASRFEHEKDAHTPIAEGKWSVAEIIRHLGEWDRFVREERLLPVKQNFDISSFPDVDEFNRIAVEPVQTMQFPDIVADARQQRDLLKKEVEEMDEATWNASFIVGSSETTAAVYLGEMLSHDAHHQRQIEEFLA